MDNRLYTNQDTYDVGYATNQQHFPNVDGFFVGHRFHDNDLEILIGKRTGDEYCIAALLNQQTAQEMVDRVGNILKSANNGHEPAYTNPATVTVGSEDIKNGDTTL